MEIVEGNIEPIPIIFLAPTLPNNNKAKTATDLDTKHPNKNPHHKLANRSNSPRPIPSNSNPPFLSSEKLLNLHTHLQ
jgi:hypothetical protein